MIDVSCLWIKSLPSAVFLRKHYQGDSKSEFYVIKAFASCTGPVPQHI